MCMVLYHVHGAQSLERGVRSCARRSIMYSVCAVPCAVFYHVHVVLLCVRCYIMWTEFYHVSAVFYHVHGVLSLVRRSIMRAVFYHVRGVDSFPLVESRKDPIRSGTQHTQEIIGF